MTLVEMLYAALQLLGKCMNWTAITRKCVSYVVTACFTPKKGMARNVKTDLRV